MRADGSTHHRRAQSPTITTFMLEQLFSCVVSRGQSERRLRVKSFAPDRGVKLCTVGNLNISSVQVCWCAWRRWHGPTRRSWLSGNFSATAVQCSVTSCVPPIPANTIDLDAPMLVSSQLIY